MGGPSPLWGREVPLFHTQNNTRNLSAGRSPQESPVIGMIVALQILHSLCHQTLTDSSSLDYCRTVKCIVFENIWSVNTLNENNWWKRSQRVGVCNVLTYGLHKSFSGRRHWKIP